MDEEGSNRKFKLGKEKSAINRQIRYIGFATIAFVLVVLIACAIFIAGIMGDNRAAVENSINEYTQTTQTALNTQIRGDFEILNMAATFLPAAEKQGDVLISSLLKQANLKNAFIRMGYASLGGDGVMYDVNGQIYKWNFLQDEKDSLFFNKALNGEPSIQMTVPDPFSENNWIIRYAVPVIQNDEVIGVVIAIHNATMFSSVIDQGEWSGYGYANIIDGEGTFIIRSNSELVSDTALSIYDLGEFSDADRMEFKYALEHEGSYSYKTTSGEIMISTITPLAIGDWHLLCSLSLAYINEPFVGDIILLAVIVIAAIVAFLSLMLLCFRMIIRGQQRLKSENEEKSVVLAQSGTNMLRYDILTRTLYNLNIRNDFFGLPPMLENYPEVIFEKDIVMPESVQEYKDYYEKMRQGEPSGSTDVRLKCVDGIVRWFHSDYKLLPDKDGKLSRSIIAYYDNTQQREKEIAYEIRTKELEAQLASSSYYVEANLMTGQVELTRGEAVNMRAFDNAEMNLYELIEWDAKSNVFPDDANDFLQFFNRNRLISIYTMGVFSDSLEFRAVLDGRFTWNRATIQMVNYPNSEEIKLYIVFSDVSEEHDKIEQLRGKATVDALTGLLNRETTMLTIENYLSGSGAKGTHALLMIDIDNFKNINDTLGHQSGDDALVEIAAAFRHCFRKDDIVGRVGGDEFFAFIKNIGDVNQLSNKANELLSEMQYVYLSEKSRIDLSVSIGITVFRGTDRPRKTLNRLYAEADAALYKAKLIGKNCFSYADDQLIAEIKPKKNNAKISLNVRRLLDNLGGGIEVYHGTPDGKLKALFCNESFLELLGGMTEDEFLAMYGEDAFKGVYPEDVEKLREVHTSSLKHGKQLQHTYRTAGKDGRYFWVTATANFIRYGDGSYDVYAVYIDAEKQVKEHAVAIDKYREFQDTHNVMIAHAAAAVRINLTRDKYEDCLGVLHGDAEKLDGMSVDEFFDTIRRRLDGNSFIGKFDENFSQKNLLHLFDEGTSSVDMKMPCLVQADRVMWIRITAKMARNPETQDVEAIIYFFDIDHETRMQYTMSKLVNTDYELLGQIDIKTGRFIVFGGITELERKLSNVGAVNYRKDVGEVLRNMIRDDFYNDAMAALSLDKVISELESVNTYVCTFPTKECEKMKEGFRQWKFSYLGERNGVILISRTDVTDMLGGDMDILTGIYNQQGFFRHARRVLDDNRDTKFRIIRFDIDNFKDVNEALGFARGDQLLRDLGGRLRYLADNSKKIIYARLESDYFVCLRPVAGPTAEEFIRLIDNWLDNYPLGLQLTTHVGEYLIENPEMEISVMCDRALMALKSVKNNFSQRVGHYDASLYDKQMEEKELIAEMRSAIEREQFEVYFQPQVNYEDGSFIGAEALVRWNHPTKGLISPGVFIPLFESAGVITPLDEYIWEKSCCYIRKWLDDPDKYQPISLSVNISRVDIYNNNLVSTIKKITDKYNVPVSMLKLEITESAYMNNSEQLMNMINELHSEGYTIEMDDFGSGWSSLNTLKDVPVDVLKLDMKFLSKGEDNERGGNILSSVIRMAHWLKLPIIAEGVETKEQADYLKSLGCFYMQGYYFARPMPAEEFEKAMLGSRQGSMNRYDKVSLEGAAAFWDPSAQTVQLFNSFVGGAAILEYQNGIAEVVRANERFFTEICTTQSAFFDNSLNILERFDSVGEHDFAAMLEEAIRTNEEAECEVQSRSSVDAEKVWTHLRVRLLAKNHDRSLFYLAIENITDRKRMEEQLRVSREALKQSIVYMGRTVCDYNIEERVLTLSEEYSQKHGLPSVIHALSVVEEKIFPEDKIKFRKFLENIRKGEEKATVLVRLSLANKVNSYSWERLDAVTVRDGEGVPVRAIITCEDITAQKESEGESGATA